MPADCCKDRWDRLMKEEPDMPVFTLLAQDALAPVVIKAWLSHAHCVGVNRGKIIRVQEHLNAIEQWQVAHPSRVKKPD